MSALAFGFWINGASSDFALNTEPMRSSLAEARAKIILISGQFDQATVDADRVRSQLDEEQRHNANLKNQLASLASETSKLNRDITEKASLTRSLDSDKRKLSAQVEENNNRIYNMEIQSTDLRGNLDRCNQARAILSSSLDKAKSGVNQIDSANARIASLQQQIDSLEKQNKTDDDTIARLSGELQSNKSRGSKGRAPINDECKILLARWKASNFRIGSFAISSNGQCGYSYNSQSLAAADESAIAQCQKVGPECEVAFEKNF